jgi:exopolysaccharide production protein ExoZ
VSNAIVRIQRLAASLYELPATGSRLTAVEGFRAYAAFLIFLVHYCDSYATRILGVDPNSLRLSTVPDLWTGVIFYLFASHYGVDLFFFLSGFLICRLLLRPDFDYRRFLVGRIARIYPAFALSLVVWACMRIAVQQWYSLDPVQLAGNLLFLNAVPAFGVKPYNSVTWSLFFEFVFYLTFPVIVWGARRKHRVTPARIAVFAAIFMPLALQMGTFFIRFLMFFGGAVLAVLPERTGRALARCVADGAAVALYLLSTLLFALWLDYASFIPIFIATTALVVVKVIHGEGVLRRWFAWTPFRYFGNISYSFYLMHGLGIEITMNFYGKELLRLGGPLYLITTFATSLAIGLVSATALFLAAERPYFTWRAVCRKASTGSYAAADRAAAK